MSAELPPFHEPRAQLGRAPTRAAAVIKKKAKRKGGETAATADAATATSDGAAARAAARQDDHDDVVMVPSWFDVRALPISTESCGAAQDGSSDDGVNLPPGLDASVEMAHGLAAALEREHGIPPENIIFGGFSQGAALAIEAGTTYPKPCAGIVSISGWWPRRRGSAQESDGGRQRKDQQDAHRIPVFFSSGTSDPEVLYAEAKASCAALAKATPDETRPFMLHACDVTSEKVQRGKHMPTRVELEKAIAWMAERLPNRAARGDTKLRVS